MLIYLLIINAVGFAVMLIDKQKAKKNRWRIPEKTLFGIALIGGSVGCNNGYVYCPPQDQTQTFCHRYTGHFAGAGIFILVSKKINKSGNSTKNRVTGFSLLKILL